MKKAIQQDVCGSHQLPYTLAAMMALPQCSHQSAKGRAKIVPPAADTMALVHCKKRQASLLVHGCNCWRQPGVADGARQPCSMTDMAAHSSLVNDSGVVKRSLIGLAPGSYSASSVALRSSLLMTLLMAAARMPRRCSAASWSCMRASSGQMTMAVPGSMSAGSM